MKNLFYLLGILAAMLFAGLLTSTTTATTTVITQPARPKQVLVEKVREMYYVENAVQANIIQRTKEGWIVKEISITTDESRSKGVIVYEKY